jgi:hypothetical protein
VAEIVDAKNKMRYHFSSMVFETDLFLLKKLICLSVED